MLVLLHDFDFGKQHFLLRLALESHSFHSHDLALIRSVQDPGSVNGSGSTDSNLLLKLVLLVRVAGIDNLLKLIQNLK